MGLVYGDSTAHSTWYTLNPRYVTVFFPKRFILSLAQMPYKQKACFLAIFFVFLFLFLFLAFTCFNKVKLFLTVEKSKISINLEKTHKFENILKSISIHNLLFTPWPHAWVSPRIPSLIEVGFFSLNTCLNQCPVLFMFENKLLYTVFYSKRCWVVFRFTVSLLTIDDQSCVACKWQ